MKNTLTLIAMLLAIAMTACVPTQGGIELPIGNPTIGVASIGRVSHPAPGTRLAFTSENEDIGNDRIRISASDRQVAVIVYDAPISTK